MSVNNTNIKREYLDDNNYNDDVDTIEADDEMDYEEEVLMEGNIMTGALTIYLSEFNRQQELRQKTVVTPKNKPQITVIGERQPRPALVQRGPVNKPNLTAIPINQLPFPPQHRTPATSPLAKGSIAVAPKNNVNNIKFNIDSLPLLQTYPVGFHPLTLKDSKPDDIVLRITQRQQQRDIAFVPGTSGWITRGLDEFEMIVLTNDFISIISTITIRFENNSYLDLSKVKFFMKEIYIDYNNQVTSGFAYTYNGKVSTATISQNILLFIARRMADRLIKIDPNTQIENIADVFKIIPFTPSWATPRVIELKKCRIVFANDQKSFILYYNVTLQQEDGTQKEGTISFNLANVVPVVRVIGSLTKVILLHAARKRFPRK
jgi:hypothetical protein